ncbi:chemotaxis protein CheW [Cyanobacterium stanieri LEGE 03274]|uniref:Chemotaxis protein CheW n=1 Tax=Cyanobacterium stanieri LEGE 03274 TaxID=1828756 RepID=A0ABR9V5B8_9CHRO|nr:chemotaxis protein CheW [Cyanobacterium stanieri]MBE9222336.1 chemotaxis protein CheW [Cyanobacterium stanieri LEGE 03274]
MSSPSSFTKLQELLPQLFQRSALTGSLYLRCRLGVSDTFLISMEYVRESLLLEGNHITPVPQMSSFVMGLMTSRERVFCVVDLPQLMGLSSLPTYSRQYHLVVISISSFLPNYSGDDDLFLGLAVNQVEGITRVDTDKILGLTDVQHLLTREKVSYWFSFDSYVQGWVTSNQQPLAVLNLESIIKATR